MKEGQVLLSRRFNTGWHDGDYDLPSGHVDPNETIKEAGAREAKEEAGLTLSPSDLDLVHVMHRHGEKADRVEFLLKVNQWEGEPINAEPDKCDDIQWFSVTGLPENMIPKTKSALEHYLAGKNYSEFNWVK